MRLVAGTFVAGTVVLDRYQVMAPFTPGEALDTVALALDQRFGRHVDLVPAPEPVGTPMGDVFRWRAHTAALLQHPVLPPILDMGLHDGHVVLVYRHAEGRLLADVIAHEARGWTMRRTLQLVADLAEALGLAHAQGLCHGSFSARSVLLERDGMVTLRNLAWPGPGTAVDRADVAPEMQMGHAPAPSADVFALGQVLRRLMHAIGTEAGRGLDDAVQEVVHRATAWVPRERYADGTALAQAIGRLLLMPDAIQTQRSVATTHASHAPVARYRPPVAAAPAARRQAGVPVQRRQRGILPALALGLAVSLLPVAGAVMHDTMDHRPFVGFLHPGDGDGQRDWGGWGQPPPWQSQGSGGDTVRAWPGGDSSDRSSP